MRATSVKRAWGFNPMTCVMSPGWGPDCSSGSFSQLPGSRRCAGGVQLERPQPRSGEDERAGRRRAAADHRERGRAPFPVWLYEGSCAVPGCGWRSGLASTHPAPRSRAGGRHDHVSGDRAAQSDDRARPVAGSCRCCELARGLVTLPACGGVVLVHAAPGAGAAPAASRW